MKNALKIENIIQEISKAYISIDGDTKDFLINGTIPQEVPQDFCVLLYRDFEHRIKLQLKENCSIELLKEYVAQIDSGAKSIDNVIGHLRVNFVLAKSKDEVGENAESTIEYIGKMLKIKIKTLSFIKRFLENEIKYFGYGTSEDYKTFDDRKEPESDILISEKTEKVTFNLSKKEAIMFLYVLEQTGVIKFNSEVHRKQFIENNFYYTEVRENEHKGKTFPMLNISSDLSVIKASHHKKTNNKTLEKLLNQLLPKFDEFEF